jgi:hypothetical protein
MNRVAAEVAQAMLLGDDDIGATRAIRRPSIIRRGRRRRSSWVRMVWLMASILTAIAKNEAGAAAIGTPTVGSLGAHNGRTRHV